MKTRLAGLVVALSFGLGAPAFAGEQFVDKNGVANFGYDVVAYHTTLAPALGLAEHSASHNDATFWFASKENRDLFLADPARYAPAYDGHCAYALVNHKKLTIDPEAFSIVDPATQAPVDSASYDPATDAGVLYLNYSASVNAQFDEDLTGNITKADFAWTDCLEHKPAARPKKGLRDFFGGGRPSSCPAA